MWRLVETCKKTQYPVRLGEKTTLLTLNIDRVSIKLWKKFRNIGRYIYRNNEKENADNNNQRKRH